MKITKENVYVNLRGKTKEQLTDLWKFLNSNGEKTLRDLEHFLQYSEHTEDNSTLAYREGSYNDWINSHSYGKTEITIQELKEIIKPNMESTQQKIERLEKELSELKSTLPKAGDIGLFTSMHGKKKIGILENTLCGYQYIDEELNVYFEFESLPNELQEKLKNYLYDINRKM